jgi:hypothetical protein
VSAAALYEVTPTSSAGAGSKVTLTIRVMNIAPSITYSSGAYSFTLAESGTTGSPTNTGGAVTGCSISPALPGGLTIHSTTCAILGTPTEVSAAKNYTVTASNAIGNSSKTVNLQVQNIVPSIDYGGTNFSYVAGDDTSLKPINTGGAITNCTIDGTLPKGLAFDSATCGFTIQPIGNMDPTLFTITPSNEVGSGKAAEVTIDVSGFK